MTYCPQCGYAIREGVTICPACGVKVVTAPEEIAVEPEIAEDLTEAVDTEIKTEETATVSEILDEAAVSDTPAPIPEPIVSEEAQEDTTVKTGYGDNALPLGKYAPVSTGVFLINQVLYMIPVLGLLFAIIIACSTKKLNCRRHALSWITLHIIFLVLVGGIFGISYTFGLPVVVASITDWLKALL